MPAETHYVTSQVARVVESPAGQTTLTTINTKATLPQSSTPTTITERLILTYITSILLSGPNNGPQQYSWPRSGPVLPYS